MRIKSEENSLNRLKFHEELKGPEKKGNPFTITDKTSFDSVDSGFDRMIKSYKELRTDHIKNKEEPWWEEMADTCHIQGDVVYGLTSSGKALMASSGLSALGAVGLSYFGARELKEGLEGKDKLKVISGSSALLAGAASGADAIASTLKLTGVMGGTGAAIAGVAGTAGLIFSVTHGSIDVGLGVREIIQGAKEKDRDKIIDGALEIGIGSSMIMCAARLGGTVAPIALGALFATKLAYNYRKEIGKTYRKVKENL